MAERIKITMVGSGYVGKSLSVLLGQHNDVTVVDIDAERVDRIREAGIDVIIYEPELNELSFYGIKVVNSLSKFKDTSDIIVTNRHSENLQDIKHKVFTRDVFNNN